MSVYLYPGAAGCGWTTTASNPEGATTSVDITFAPKGISNGECRECEELKEGAPSSTIEDTLMDECISHLDTIFGESDDQSSFEYYLTAYASNEIVKSLIKTKTRFDCWSLMSIHMESSVSHEGTLIKFRDYVLSIRLSLFEGVIALFPSRNSKEYLFLLTIVNTLKNEVSLEEMRILSGVGDLEVLSAIIEGWILRIENEDQFMYLKDLWMVVFHPNSEEK